MPEVTIAVLAAAVVALTVLAVVLARKAAVASARLAVSERRLEEQRRDFDERLRRERDDAAERFASMALQALNANSEMLDRQNRRSVETVLAPVRTQLEDFTRRFLECYSSEGRERASMREEIRALHSLGEQVGAQTARLASALKGNTAVQGRWGEMVLLNILEHSGLERGEWFVLQQTAEGPAGPAVRPDAVVHCPGGRDIIIDAKTSLTAYLASLEAESEAERDQLVKAHVRSVEKHIRTLRDKDYQKAIGVNSADFVFMFMPHEGAYLAAMHAKPELWNEAFDSRVVIASPTHLVTAIHLVEHMWKTEKQSLNAQKIADQGAKLLDSLALLLKELTDLGTHLHKADEAYRRTVGRMQGGTSGIARIAGDLAALGVRSKRSVPQPFRPEEDKNPHTEYPYDED